MTTAARADHHGMTMPDDDESSRVDASVALLAATFSPSQSDQMYYGGNYEGVAASGGWAMDRYAAGASWAYYRVRRNGFASYGIGDLVVHGQVAILRGDVVQAGVVIGVSAPTGNDVTGLGMGHPMVMPAAWGMWHRDRLSALASVGYSRAIVDLSMHVHGMAPLVEPMNMSELTWAAGGDYAIAGQWRAGLRLSGGVPIAISGGVDRVVGGVRVAWGNHRLETAGEVQAGLAGDPFNIRAVLSTAIRF